MIAILTLGEFNTVQGRKTLFYGPICIVHVTAQILEKRI